jgi:hypothetical protein
MRAVRARFAEGGRRIPPLAAHSRLASVSVPINRAHQLLAAAAVAAYMLMTLCWSVSAAGAVQPPQLLPRSGEMPGFKPSSPIYRQTTIAQVVYSDPRAVRKSDSSHLRRAGFIASAYQQQAGDGGGRNGLAAYFQFHTPAGARRYLNFYFAGNSQPGPWNESASQARFGRFRIRGVPGARGSTQVARHKKGAAANLLWIEGRCVILVGDHVPVRAPDTHPLIAAAQAIYRRTRGAC